MSNNIVDSRIKKVLSMRTDTANMIESLDAIAEFFVEGNSVDSRRSLRPNIEHQNIEIAKKFLIEQEIVKTKLEIVKNNIREVHNTCQAMSNQVNSGKYSLN